MQTSKLACTVQCAHKVDVKYATHVRTWCSRR